MNVASPIRAGCRNDESGDTPMVKPTSQHARYSNDPQPHLIRRKAVAVAVAACFSTGVALANPTTPTVVHGTASFNQAGSILNVTNSHNAIINWGSFSIGINELTKFIQPSALSAVLNRVVGQDPSAILGALQSNGRVFLINPNGIVFGAGAQINVAGLVASTLNLSNDDFLNNRMRFTDGAGAGSVVNQGSITGGSVYLVGNAVTNNGLITSPNGEVVLAAGNTVELVNPGTPNLRVEVVAPDNEVRNLGAITAEAGRIGIYAGLIKQGGVINADSAVAQGGRVMLKSTRNTTLDAGSQTTASGTVGGTVEIQSGDTTLVSGAMAATGSAGNGGVVHVLGNKVGLLDAASIDASGQTGGGMVLVGGDYQGKNPDVQNAYRAYVGPNATIKADAISQGDGGRVVVWSDDATRFYGNISARGGATGGDGGFVEVSGKRWLDYKGLADTRAPNGATGTLLLDPSNISIVAGAGDGSTTTGSFDGDPFYLSGTLPAEIEWFTIKNQLVFSNAIISTSSGAVEAGNITIAANSPDLATGNTLDLRANNNIIVNGSVTNTGIGNVVMYAGYNDNFTTPGVVPGVGSITLNAPIAIAGEAHLVAGGVISQSAPGAISAAGLLAVSNAGSVDLSNPANSVGIIAGRAKDSFTFKNSNGFTVGSVGGIDGINANNTAYGGNAAINLQSTGGGVLVVDRGISAHAGPGANGGEGDVGEVGGSASVTLTSDGGIVLNYYGVYAMGGSGGLGSSAARGNGGHATVTLNNSASAAGIQSNAYISAYGGGGFTGGNAKIEMTSAGGITVTNSLSSTGGYGITSTYGGTAYGGSAAIQLDNTSTSALLDVSGYVNASGGGTGYAYGPGSGGDAEVVMNSAGGIQITNTVNVYGGYGEQGGKGGAASARLTSTGGSGILIDNGEIYARGGDANSTSVSNGGAGGAAEVKLVSSGGVMIDGGEWGGVEARGGQGGTAYGSSSTGGAGGAATVIIQNTSTTAPVEINGYVIADGGTGGEGGGGISVGGKGGDAGITVSSSHNIDILGSGYLDASGGNGGTGAVAGYGDALSVGGAGGNASIVLTAAGGITVAGTGGYYNSYGIYVRGGNGGDGGYSYGSSYSYTYTGTGGKGGNAEVMLQAGNGISLIDYGYINVSGGRGGGYYWEADDVRGDGGHATVTLINTGAAPITMSGYEGIYAEGGEGATGGNATVTMTSAGGISLSNNSYIEAYGGEGAYGAASPGGAASIRLTSTSTTAGILIDGGEVYANGGDGGYRNDSGTGGVGGAAEVIFASAGGISVSSYVEAQGGDGGWAYSYGTQGNGGAATMAFTNTSTTAPIDVSYSVYADGGSGGERGGDASMTMTSAGGINISGGLYADGGYAEGLGGSGGAGQGGMASIVLTNTNPSAEIAVMGGYVNAGGGSYSGSYGGSPSTGGDALVILSSAGGISISSYGAVYADGGSGGQGGAAGVTLLAGGNIAFADGGEGSAWGGDGSIGGNASFTAVAGGNISIASNYYGYGIQAFGGSGESTAASSVVLSAAGNVLLQDAYVESGGVVGIGAANVILDNSYVWGDAGVTVDASGSLNVVNDSSLAGGGIATINTGGNVLVENNGTIAGYPDVMMKVGGEVFMNTGGRIEAGLPTTIHLLFPMLASGGYSVNGVSGVVFDGSTGFFADGSGAILGQNLLVTYGGGATIEIPTNVLFASMDDSIKPPDPEKDKDVFEDEKDMKKKNLAVCR